MPESPAFLIARRTPDALARLNQVLTGLGHLAVKSLPALSGAPRGSVKDLFAPGTTGTILRLIAANVLLAISAYYMLSWLPQLVADAGLPVATGSLVSAVSGFVGFSGGVAFGLFAGRAGPARLAAISMMGLALALAAIGLIPGILPMFLVAAGAFGFFLAGSTGMFYAVLASSFPPLMRASGIGVVMGIGRISSAAGPALAGWAFAGGWSRGEVSLAFSIGPVLAAALIATFKPKFGGVTEPAHFDPRR